MNKILNKDRIGITGFFFFFWIQNGSKWKYPLQLSKSAWPRRYKWDVLVQDLDLEQTSKESKGLACSLHPGSAGKLETGRAEVESRADLWGMGCCAGALALGQRQWTIGHRMVYLRFCAWSPSQPINLFLDLSEDSKTYLLSLTKFLFFLNSQFAIVSN